MATEQSRDWAGCEPWPLAVLGGPLLRRGPSLPWPPSPRGSRVLSPVSDPRFSPLSPAHGFQTRWKFVLCWRQSLRLTSTEEGEYHTWGQVLVGPGECDLTWGHLESQNTSKTCVPLATFVFLYLDYISPWWAYGV